VGKSFTNLQQLEQYLKEKINESLQVEVAEMVKDKISQHTQTDVYDKYDPVFYKRRYFDNGGLGDETRMGSKLVSDGILEVQDNNDFNHPWAYTHGGYGDIDTDKSLAYNIEFGYGDMDEPYNRPRPFIEKTREEIQGKSLHTLTMKKALQTRLGSGAVK